MNLQVRALMSRIQIAAEQSGVTGFRIAYKQNAHGEHVVAVLWPINIAPEITDREAKRLARQR